MIIGQFNVDRLSVDPLKAHSVLVVNANAVLSRTISLELFQATAGDRKQVGQSPCLHNHSQSLFCLPSYSTVSLDIFGAIDPLGVAVSEWRRHSSPLADAGTWYVPRINLSRRCNVIAPSALESGEGTNHVVSADAGASDASASRGRRSAGARKSIAARSTTIT